MAGVCLAVARAKFDGLDAESAIAGTVKTPVALQRESPSKLLIEFRPMPDAFNAGSAGRLIGRSRRPCLAMRQLSADRGGAMRWRRPSTPRSKCPPVPRPMRPWAWPLRETAVSASGCPAMAATVDVTIPVRTMTVGHASVRRSAIGRRLSRPTDARSTHVRLDRRARPHR